MKRRCVSCHVSKGLSELEVMMFDVAAHCREPNPGRHRLGNSVALFFFLFISSYQTFPVSVFCWFGSHGAVDVDAASCSAGPRAAGQSEIFSRQRSLAAQAIRQRAGGRRVGWRRARSLSVRPSARCGGCERMHGSLGFLRSRHTEGVRETGFRCLLCDPILIAEIEFMYIFIFF